MCPIAIKKGQREAIYFDLVEKGITPTALYYKLIPQVSGESFSRTKELSNEILNFPVHQDTTPEDIDAARHALILAAKKPARVLTTPGPRVNIMAAGSSAIQLQLRFWIGDPKNGIRNVMSEVLEEIIHNLKIANVNIPFDTLDINIRSLPD